jgi:hypothetical protein
LILAIPMLALVGCAAHPTTTASALPDRHTLESAYAEPPSATSALMFDPPIAQEQQPLQLARDDHQPWAFGGYPSSVVEYYNIHTDDNQLYYGGGSFGGFGRGRGFVGGFGSDGNSGYYQRRAITDRSGVIYR